MRSVSKARPSYWETIRIPTSGWRWRASIDARTPLVGERGGSRTSTIATSGWWGPDLPQQPVGVLCLPDDLDPVLAKERHEPLAKQGLVLDDHHSQAGFALSAAADCLGDVVAVRMIPDTHLIGIEQGVDLLALGSGPKARCFACSVGTGGELMRWLQASRPRSAPTPETGFPVNPSASRSPRQR
jgi:hypothetical protein